jgi:hypothetical protein
VPLPPQVRPVPALAEGQLAGCTVPHAWPQAWRHTTLQCRSALLALACVRAGGAFAGRACVRPGPALAEAGPGYSWRASAVGELHSCMAPGAAPCHAARVRQVR